MVIKINLRLPLSMLTSSVDVSGSSLRALDPRIFLFYVMHPNSLYLHHAGPAFNKSKFEPIFDSFITFESLF